MLNRLRSSFAAKLLLGGLVLSLVIIGGVAGYLLVSRDNQTRQTALSNADNRAAVMRQVLLRFTGAQAYSAAHDLASQAALAAALAAPQRASTVPALFASSSPVDVAGDVLLITGADGQTLYAHADPALGAISLAPYEQAAAVGDSLSGDTCALAGSNAAGACGVEVLASGEPAFTVAVPVLDGGQVVGAVAYVAPLQAQLDRFNALFQFPTAFIPASRPSLELRQRNGQDVIGTTPPEIAAAVAQHADPADATYTAPLPGAAPAAVAGSFVPVTGPDGHSVTGYVGVEVPLAPFLGDEQTDELTLGVITLFVLLLLALAVILFVEIVVRRPIRRLERGVARIAGGDYTSQVEVRSNDELGRLARSVNRMRDSIRRYTSEIEAARERLDSNVERVSGVSRALTSTAGGVTALEQEVVRAAAAIAGPGASAVLAEVIEGALVVRAAQPVAAAGELDLAPLGALLDGETVRRTVRRDELLALPMFNQDEVAGALIVRRPEHAPADDEAEVLAVLANNAAIAMQNARMYEQERETVRRLRELDAMKNDFLATVQHELRTPLTAILGLSDLIDMCWGMWDDEPKLEAVRDIQIAARNLYDIVETLIDFSSVEGEGVAIHATSVPVAAAVDDAVRLVTERYKGGLPIPVRIQVAPEVAVLADPERFGQVLRALIDNAVKFSDGRGDVAVTASPGDEEHVRIEVADQGIGIGDADLPRIFERFFQVDNTATRRYGGTGMGLALVRELVRAHGASIDVRTALGEGTRVILQWPAPAPVDAALEAEPAPV